MKKIIILIFAFFIFASCKTQVKEENKVQKGGNLQQNAEITATLKSLVVKQGEAEVSNFQNIAQNVFQVALTKKVSDSEYIEIIAEPKEEGAKISIDGVEGRIKKYTSFKQNINILVENGSANTLYTLTLSENNSPPKPPKPEKPPVPENYTLKCNVVDSSGGSNVEGATVKVYKVFESAELKTGLSDSEGNAYFELEADANYDLVISKNGYASSRLENVYIRSNVKEAVSSPLRIWSVGSKAEPPEINEVFLFNEDTSKKEKINENDEIDVSAFTNKDYLYITTTCKSTSIIPLRTVGGNFGLSFNINSSLSGNGGWGKFSANPFNNASGTNITKDGMGNVSQNWGFKLEKLNVPNGEAVLHFIAYDVAGNRCERMQRVKFKNSTHKDTLSSKYRFTSFKARSERFARSLSLFEDNGTSPFGMPTEDGLATSARVVFNFRFNVPVEISSVDVLRRDYRIGNIKDGWQVVYTKQYRGGYTGEKDDAGHKVLFRLLDDSGTLEESKVYQYKLVAHSEDGRIESNVATLRIMEAFNISLTSPKNRSVFAKNDLRSLDFSFKISNPVLWDKDVSDHFYFDVLVVEDGTTSTGNLQEFGVCFASKLRYSFNTLGDGRLKLAGEDENYRKYSDWIYNPSLTFKVDDLVKYDKGIVTVTHDFLNTPYFDTFVRKSLFLTANKASMYYWDIQDIGSDALSPFDDRGAFFTKEYSYRDRESGSEIGFEKAISASYANLNRVGGAINGRAMFILKD